MMTDSQKRTLIVTEAISWLGTRWHHKAMVKGAGVDCAMLLYATYLNCGFIEPMIIEDYPRDWALHNNTEKFITNVEHYAHRVDSPKSADIVLFKTGKTHSHGAIILDYPRIIHAECRAGVIYGDAESDVVAHCSKLFYSVF